MSILSRETTLDPYPLLEKHQPVITFLIAVSWENGPKPRHAASIILVKIDHNTYYIKVEHNQYLSHIFGRNYGYFLSFCLILAIGWRKSIAGFLENLENLEYEKINFQAWKIPGSGK